MHHIHIGAIPITKPAKQSYAIPTSELKTPKTLSSRPNFTNLNFAKIVVLFYSNSLELVSEEAIPRCHPLNEDSDDNQCDYDPALDFGHASSPFPEKGPDPIDA